MSFFVAGCPKKKTDPSQTTMQKSSQNDNGPGTTFPGDGMNPDDGLNSRNKILGKYTTREAGLLQSVYFAFDQSHIRPSERVKAESAANYLKANPNNGIEIVGYCDWRGTTEYNLGLGDRRAGSVRDYLISMGIDGSRINVVSKGDLDATVKGNAEQTAHDRRAELIVLK